MDWDLRLTGAYPKAAEHFKVVYFLSSKSIEIYIGLIKIFFVKIRGK